MKEKIHLEVELEPEDLKMLDEIAKKMNMTTGGLLLQELKEKLAELDVWEHRFKLLHQEKEN